MTFERFNQIHLLTLMTLATRLMVCVFTKAFHDHKTPSSHQYHPQEEEKRKIYQTPACGVISGHTSVDS